MQSGDGLFLVSDGMGGMNSGERAARLVVDALPDIVHEKLARVSDRSAETICEVLRTALIECSNHMIEVSRGDPVLDGMGATVVLLWLRGWTAYVAHMGDSRVYLYREGVLKQLTEDHSVVWSLLRYGLLTEEEAREHPARSHILQHIGMPDGAEPDVRHVGLQAGDRYLLCTDGLTGMLSDATIEEILSQHDDPQKACRELCDAANLAGGWDNITALIVDYG